MRSVNRGTPRWDLLADEDMVVTITRLIILAVVVAMTAAGAALLDDRLSGHRSSRE